MGTGTSIRVGNRFGRLKGLIAALVCWASAVLPLQAHMDSVVLQLKWTNAFQFAGYYAAVEQGYYREAGIEVQLLQGGPDTDFAEELASGRAQYAVALSSMLVHRVHGKPVVALAAIFQHSPEVLLTLRTSGINNPHQLAGRTVMVSAEDTPAILAMFKNEGLHRDAVTIIPYQFDYGLFEDGKIDAMAAYVTNEPYYFKNRDVEVVMIQPRNYGVDFYGDCLFTSEKELREHPKRVAAFREASLRGWQYAMQHREEIADLILKKYPAPNISRESLLYEAERMEELMFPNLIPVGHMNRGRWKHIGDTYVRLGILPPDYTRVLDGFIYDPDPDAKNRWLLGVAAISVAATLVLAALVLFLIWVNHRIKSAEREARAARNILQTVLDTIPVAVFWKDKESRYLGCNKVFAEYAGLGSPEQVRGLSDADLPWGEDSGEYEKSDRQVLESGLPIVRYEEDVVTNGGETVEVYLKSKSPLRDASGKIWGVLGVAENISALKNSEEHRLAMSERVQQAEKFESLGRLIGGMSHHFNNILQSVVINTELAAKPVPAGHPIKDSLEVVLKEIRRAIEISRILLSTVGRGSFDFQVHSLDKLVEGCLPALKEAVAKGQDVSLSLKGGATRIKTDPQSLELILVNLVRNASEALGADPAEIRVETGRVVCDRAYLNEPYLQKDLPEGEYACIEVVDNGPGMTEEVRKKVFDPFFSTKFEGRGLGMAVVLGIVRSHRGAVKITSAVNKGTSVRVLLPLEKH